MVGVESSAGLSSDAHAVAIDTSATISKDESLENPTPTLCNVYAGLEFAITGRLPSKPYIPSYTYPLTTSDSTHRRSQAKSHESIRLDSTARRPLRNTNPCAEPYAVHAVSATLRYRVHNPILAVLRPSNIKLSKSISTPQLSHRTSSNPESTSDKA